MFPSAPSCRNIGALVTLFLSFPSSRPLPERHADRGLHGGRGAVGAGAGGSCAEAWQHRVQARVALQRHRREPRQRQKRWAWCCCAFIWHILRWLLFCFFIQRSYCEYFLLSFNPFDPLHTGPGPESPSPVGLWSSNNICVKICVTSVSLSQLLFLGKSCICIFPSVSLGQPCFPLFFHIWIKDCIVNNQLQRVIQMSPLFLLFPWLCRWEHLIVGNKTQTLRRLRGLNLPPCSFYITSPSDSNQM